MKLAVYGHGGSQNHGNEAIVRGIRELFPDSELTLYTFSKEADRHFGLDRICEIKDGVDSKNVPLWLKVFKRLFPNLSIIKKLYYADYFAPMLKDIQKDCIYLLEAGDQYCEPGEHRDWYAFLNRKIKEYGGKTVMLGCTINPELFNSKKMISDLNNYDLIIARESITYNAITKSGVHTTVKQAPCPAFAMKLEAFDIPHWVEEKKFIGFNVGFLAQGNERYYDLLIRNYDNCIKWVLEETDFEIALIPHVNWNYDSTDFKELDDIERRFNYHPRIHYVEEHSAPKQKYIISNCFAFVSLRTHATVPALELGVPTIITGYKTKSKGIAKDIFGDKFNVLADVQSLNSEWDIQDKLKNVLASRSEIINFSASRMPEYLSGLDIIVQSIKKLVE